jgi:hypothetical protein
MDIMRENQEHNTAAIVVVGKGKKNITRNAGRRAE